MLQRVLLSGLVSGVIAGAVLTLVHLGMVQPLIVQAESFERAAVSPGQAVVAHRHASGLSHAHAGGGVAHTHEVEPVFHAHASGLSHAHAAGGMVHTHEVEPVFHAHAGGLSHAHTGGDVVHSHETTSDIHAEGAERTLFTLLANLLMGIGYGLLLAAAWVVYGRPVSLSQGFMWGAAGFVSFAFMPALGLPPELPGAVAGDLVARQSWWLFTAFGTAAGLALCAFSGKWTLRAAGAAIIVLPHIIGAPHADGGLGGSAAPELAAQFVIMSLFASAVLWAALGGVGAYVAARVNVFALPTARVAPKPSA